MQSKVLGIPFVAILFVILTSIVVAFLVSLYLTVFIFTPQTRQLNQVVTLLQETVLQPTPVITPVPVATPTAELKPVVKTQVKTFTSSTSAK